MNQKRLVCLCNHVSALEIKKMLRAGALTTSEIQKFTTAGTGCGRCLTEIDALVEKHEKEAKRDPQFKLNFK
jgi:bacterioferritin-associated ferredoxin